MKIRITPEDRIRRRKHIHAITTKETCAKGGRVAGRAMAESGRLKLISSHESCVRGGQRGGRTTVDSGKLAACKTPESLAEGGRVQGRENARIGWLRHIALVRYGKPHTDCIFCKKFSPPSGNDVHAAFAATEQK